MSYYEHFIRFEKDQLTFSQAKHWCRKEFGLEGTLDRLRIWRCGERWDPRYCFGFCFRDGEDAMAFKLRWA